MKRKWISTIAIALLLTAAAVADDVHTIADINGPRHLPAADFVLVFEKNVASLYDRRWNKLAICETQEPSNRNESRKYALDFIVKVAHDDAIYLIIDDQYKQSKAGLYYKANIKRVSPKDVQPERKP